MSDKKEKQAEQKIEEEVKEVKKEISEVESLQSKIVELNKEIESHKNKISSYEYSITKMNSEYSSKVLEKAQQAQKMINDKISEMQLKQKDEISLIKKYALEKDAKELVGIIDQFNQAVSFPVADPKIANFQMGFKMFASMFNNVLNNMGISMININLGDQFDSNTMEAIDTVENNELEENAVAQVIQNGYKLHDRVIKIAMVKIVKN